VTGIEGAPGVAVVVGTGGIGLASARRVGHGRELILVDSSEERLADLTERLARDGFAVRGLACDVADRTDVAALADEVARRGRIGPLVHTAGLSPTMASTERVLEVDMLGVVHVIDAFEPLVGPGTVGVVIASMAGTLAPQPARIERRLATGEAGQLMALAAEAGITSPPAAYAFSKRANQLRVEARAAAWGRRGARLVSVSPGIIATGMGHRELASEESGPMMAKMVASSALTRLGTAEDVAAAVAWVCSREASFVTGADVLVDGGTVAALRYST
jgi:NAD(P)-dependent dehydrogenase (short-subunit alcohol dehydrogenase family)